MPEAPAADTPDAMLEWAVLFEEMAKIARANLLPKKGDPEITVEQLGALLAALRSGHEEGRVDTVRSTEISPNYARYQEAREILMLEVSEYQKILDQIDKGHKIRYQRAEVLKRQEKYDG